MRGDTAFTHIVCLHCAHTMPPDAMAASCAACGGAWLEACYDEHTVGRLWPRVLARRTPGLWRYAELLPVPGPDDTITLGEGGTPLLRLHPYEALYGHRAPIYVKDERRNPTNSFKDRQAAVAVTALRQAGVRAVTLASTGNAGVAYAAYCARAGIQLWLFVNSLVPVEKMREAALYGAEVVKVNGTYDETKHVAAEVAARKGILYDRGAKSIPGKESMKTIAFELAEQIGLAEDGPGHFAAPD